MRPQSRSPLSPGAYLRKRREAAGLTVYDAALRLASLPWAIRPVSADDLQRLQAKLAAAEADRAPFTFSQAELLRCAFPFDCAVYEQLLLIRAGGPEATGSPGVPDPRLCRECACSFHDACLTDHGPCAWAEPDLCTACARRRWAAGDLRGAPASPDAWPDAPLPAGAHP